MDSSQTRDVSRQSDVAQSFVFAGAISSLSVSEVCAAQTDVAVQFGELPADTLDPFCCKTIQSRGWKVKGDIMRTEGLALVWTVRGLSRVRS